MEFIKAKDPRPAIGSITARVQQELAGGKKVLWLLCGGSAISAEVEILQTLQKKSDTEHLAIMLMDERFGEYGHVDSNWQQLIQAGADFGGMYALPVMSEVNKTMEETSSDYTKLTKVVLDNADIVIGIFGIGSDGHTAGMLPGSPATKSNLLVAGYDSPPFVRITMTKNALENVDVAYALAFGDAKKTALEDLRANKKSFVDLPSTIFWDLPEAYIYNDQIGDNL